MRSCASCGTYLVRSRPHTADTCASTQLANDMRKAGWYPTPKRYLRAFGELGLCVVLPTARYRQPQRWSPREAINLADDYGPRGRDLRPYQKKPLPASAQEKIRLG